MATTSIVIAEQGTDWVHWARRLRGPEDGETVVLMQDQLESPDAFARRALSKVERLLKNGEPLSEAAFLSGESATLSERRARSRIVRSLSSSLSKARNARLYLNSAPTQSPVGQRMMRALAWALSDLARGTGLTICVVGASGHLL